MELKGSRVHLRPISSEDTDLILRWRSRDEIRAQLFSDRPPTRDEHERFLARLQECRDRLEFMIVLNDDGACVGTIGLSHISPEAGEAEYGILIGEERARGKGLAREASELLLDYAFTELQLQRVTLDVFADNPSALSLYRRLGFRPRPEGATVREKDGVMRQVMSMVTTPSERNQPEN